ncbi:MAG: DNA-3-methyladenine glycosylase I [Clostridiales bacterium]|nr:DNA-3-methyladenine glycosylase I [Clostridiales bacterium]
MIRCNWCEGDTFYESYHDNVWGNPVYDDTKLFEFLTLEGAQAGLSWITILRRQESYKEAFDYYDLQKITAYDEDKIESLMHNEKIIRNRLKIMSVVKNANAVLQIQKEYGSFSEFLWAYVDHKPILNHFNSMEDVPAETELSKQISKDLKKRGFSFVGPTIIYAYMQAIGMVNDHISSCFLHKD